MNCRTGFLKRSDSGCRHNLRRAAVSSFEYCEGAARGSVVEYARFLQIARASLMEVDTQLWLCKDLGFVAYEQPVPEQIEMLFAKINALITSKQRKGRDA